MTYAFKLASPKSPLLFQEFFAMGKEEVLSPFLTVESRKWAADLTLKASLFASVLLFLGFILSFFPFFVPLAYVLLIGVYVFSGIPALIEAVEDLLAFDVNIDVLMTLAAFSSFIIGSGFEGGLLLVLFALSGSIEDSVTAKAKSSLHSLKKIFPTKASLIREDGSVIDFSVDRIEIGSKLLVKAHEIVPLDGLVEKGTSSLNMVHLTGESLPITKKPGDIVASGARNLEGALEILVTKTSKDSTLSQIIRLVTEAHEARPKLQRWFDNWSRTYSLSIIFIALFFALFLPAFFSFPFLGLEGSLYRALAFLIAASPCALIIAIPIAYLSAVSSCAREGILIKGGITLDALASCHGVAFDKTGTLTTGELICLSVQSLSKNGSINQEKAVAIAASLEKNAVHPIAKAILSFAKKEKISFYPLESFSLIPGYGLKGTIKEENQLIDVFIGNMEGISPYISSQVRENIWEEVQECQKRGEGVALLAIQNQVFLFRFTDKIRENAKKTLQILQTQEKLTLYLLSGDHSQNTKAFAKDLPFDEVLGDLRPQDKLKFIEKLSKEKGLAMVGDGVNDAPALARATVGIAMGKEGSQAALDAADAVFLQDSIEKLTFLFQKARATKRIVNQNLIIATTAIVFASMPALLGIVPLWLAVVLHEGGTLLVGLNALRLFWK